MSRITFLDYWRMGRARGWGYPIRYFTQSHLFDLVRGTNTHFWMPPKEYDGACPGHGDAVHYVACPTKSIRKALKVITAHAKNTWDQFQFYDLGCGKGKALLVYNEYVGTRVKTPAIGIELVPSLAEVAENNIHLRHLEKRATVITGDATKWRSSCTGRGAIIFLYNPFGRSTLEAVLRGTENLPCYIAYVDPEHSSLLASKGWDKIHCEAGKYKNDNIEVWYRNDVCEGQV